MWTELLKVFRWVSASRMDRYRSVHELSKDEMEYELDAVLDQREYLLIKETGFLGAVFVLESWSFASACLVYECYDPLELLERLYSNQKAREYLTDDELRRIRSALNNPQLLLEL